MNAIRRCSRFIICLSLVSALAQVSSAGEVLIEPLQPYVAGVVDSFGEIPQDRRAILEDMAALVSQRIAAGEAAPISFVCIQNSRRSHLSQVWAQTAADYYGLSGVTTYSGGTSATACNIRTIRALRRAGFSAARATDGDNPHYLIQYAENLPPIDAFSKVYNEEGNPTEGYLAAMCCVDSDGNCPVVQGAAALVSLAYEDPKAADDTPEENARYDERCRQIAIEMFYVMSRVAEATGR